MKKLSIGIVMIASILLFATNVFPYMYANESNSAYQSGETSMEMDVLIKKGAGHFFLSVANFNTFLYRFETQQSDLVYWLELSRADMIKAEQYFINLHSTAQVSMVNPLKIAQLNAFDYQGYMSENSLNGAVYEDVKALLSVGRVADIYRNLSVKMRDIITGIDCLILTINSGQTTSLPFAWRLNQDFVELSLFGQYVAEIFIQIK